MIEFVICDKHVCFTAQTECIDAVCEISDVIYNFTRKLKKIAMATFLNTINKSKTHDWERNLKGYLMVYSLH